jgi:citrate synthase
MASLQVELGRIVPADPSVEQIRLLDLIVEAHQKAARENANGSTQAFLMAVQGSGSLRQGIVAAMMTMGLKHAPIAQARWVYEHATEQWLASEVKAGRKIAGFGSTFHRDQMDPAFQEVSAYLSAHFTDQFSRLASLVFWVRSATNRKLYPNAGMFTAVASVILKIPNGLEELLFLMARMPVWAELALPPVRTEASEPTNL